jgi:hypothetical protein
MWCGHHSGARAVLRPLRVTGVIDLFTITDTSTHEG